MCLKSKGVCLSLHQRGRGLSFFSRVEMGLSHSSVEWKGHSFSRRKGVCLNLQQRGKGRVLL